MLWIGLNLRVIFKRLRAKLWFNVSVIVNIMINVWVTINVEPRLILSLGLLLRFGILVSGEY